MKAQGNQLTKLKVKEVILNHAIGEGKEPWPSFQAEAPEIDSAKEIEDAEIIKEDSIVSTTQEKVDKKEEMKGSPIPKVIKEVKSKKASVEKEKKSKVEPKKKNKANKSDKKIDSKKVDEESASNTIEWDLSNDQSDNISVDKQGDEQDGNDQMTLF